jgi:hypothetical protein
MLNDAIWPTLDYSRVPYRLYHDPAVLSADPEADGGDRSLRSRWPVVSSGSCAGAGVRLTARAGGEA